MERIECKKDGEIWENEEHILQLRHWVSLRGQTLCRTSTEIHHLSLNSYLVSVLFTQEVFALQSEEWCIIDELWSFRLSLTWLMKKVLTCSLKLFSFMGISHWSGTLFILNRDTCWIQGHNSSIRRGQEIPEIALCPTGSSRWHEIYVCCHLSKLRKSEAKWRSSRNWHLESDGQVCSHRMTLIAFLQLDILSWKHCSCDTAILLFEWLILMKLKKERMEKYRRFITRYWSKLLTTSTR